MKKKKQIKLSITYIKKVNIAGEGSLGFEKECIIRRTPDQYAIEIRDGIRYVIFEDTNESKGYTVVGKKMGGNKYKNYFLTSFDKQEVSGRLRRLGSAAVGELTIIDVSAAFKSLIDETKDHKEKFNQFVLKNFGIDYDNSAS